MPPNRPESALARDVGLDAQSPTATFEEASAAQRIRAADVLAAVADLVSAGMNDMVEPGPTFSGLARRLEDLEARLKHGAGPDDSVSVSRTAGQVEPRIEAAPAVETAASDELAVGAGRAHEAPGRESGIEIDSAIRNLTIRMAALHREALRRGTFAAVAGKNQGTAARSVVPPASERSGPSAETGAEASDRSGVAAVDASFDASAALTTLLRRLEAKVDALVGKAEADAASAADRHQTDLLARRIESSELQLAKRFDTSFTAAAVETRVIEDMLRGLAARSEAQGDLGGALATLDRSVGAVRERLDRIEEQIAALASASRGVELRQDGAQKLVPAFSSPERETADRQFGATLDAIRDTLSGIADRLRLVETHLSATHHAFAGATPWGRTPSPVLPWSEAEIRPSRGDKGKGHSAGFGSMFGPNGDKARHAGLDPNADSDVLIEPGSGFAPVLEPRGPDAKDNLGLDTDECGGRTDFIEAARRAVRTAHGPLESRPAEDADATPETRENIGAKARRLARIVRCSIFRV